MPTNRNPEFEKPLTATELRARAGRGPKTRTKAPHRFRKAAELILRMKQQGLDAQADQLLADLGVPIDAAPR